MEEILGEDGDAFANESPGVANHQGEIDPEREEWERND